MIQVLKTKKELDRVLRQQKRSGDEIRLLITDLWSPISLDLVDAVENYDKHIYLVNTFDVPEATTPFGINKVPALLTIRGSKKEFRVRLEDYPAMIYTVLRL